MARPRAHHNYAQDVLQNAISILSSLKAVCLCCQYRSPLSSVAIYSLRRERRRHTIDKRTGDEDRMSARRKMSENMQNIKCLLFIVFATVVAAHGNIGADKTLEKVSDSWIIFLLSILHRKSTTCSL